MSIEGTVKTRLTWNESAFNRIEAQTWFNALRVAKAYAAAIKKELKKNVGSVPAKQGGGKRVRIKHSKPGEVPYWQTGELEQSIEVVVQKKGRNVFVATVLAKGYAKTLELGGLATPEPHTISSVELVNPITKPVLIAPRPVWIPTFTRMAPEMQNKLSRSV